MPMPDFYSMQNRIAFLEGQVFNQRKKIEDLNKTIASKDKTFLELRSAKNREIYRALMERDSHSVQAKQFKSEMAELKAKAEAESAGEKFDHEIVQGLRSEIETLKNALAKSKGDCFAISNSHSKSTAKIEELEQKCQVLQKSLRIANENSVTSSTSKAEAVENLKTECESKAKALEQIQLENADLKKQIALHGQNSKWIENNLKSANSEKKTLKEALEKKNEELTQVTDELRQIRTDMFSSSAKALAQSQELSLTKAALEKLRIDFSKLADDKLSLEKKLNTEIVELKNNIQSKDVELEKFNQQAVNNDQLHQEVASLKIKNESLTCDAVLKQSQMDDLVKDRDKMKSKVKFYQTTKQEDLLQIRKGEKKIKSLAKENDSLNLENAKLNDAVLKARKESDHYNRLETKIAMMEMKNNGLAEQLEKNEKEFIDKIKAVNFEAGKEKEGLEQTIESLNRIKTELEAKLLVKTELPDSNATLVLDLKAEQALLYSRVMDLEGEKTVMAAEIEKLQQCQSDVDVTFDRQMKDDLAKLKNETMLKECQWVEMMSEKNCHIERLEAELKSTKQQLQLGNRSEQQNFLFWEPSQYMQKHHHDPWKKEN